jgi:hypothetical protein
VRDDPVGVGLDAEVLADLARLGVLDGGREGHVDGGRAHRVDGR